MVQGVIELGWSTALPGYSLANIDNEYKLKLAGIVIQLQAVLDWIQLSAHKYGSCGPVILSGWSPGGHLTVALLNHPIVTAGLAISGLYECGPLLDAPHVKDNLELSEKEISELSPMRMRASRSFNKRLSIAYCTQVLPAFIANSRDSHAQRVNVHLHGYPIPVIGANHFTVLDGLRSRKSHLTRALMHLAEVAVEKRKRLSSR